MFNSFEDLEDHLDQYNSYIIDRDNKYRSAAEAVIKVLYANTGIEYAYHLPLGRPLMEETKAICLNLHIDWDIWLYETVINIYHETVMDLTPED